MTFPDTSSSHFDTMPCDTQRLRIVMVDSHGNIERGGAVQSSRRGARSTRTRAAPPLCPEARRKKSAICIEEFDR